MRRAAIDDQEHRVCGSNHRLRNSMKTSALTPPFSLIMKLV
jgi:hypothetical protein